MGSQKSEPSELAKEIAARVNERIALTGLNEAPISDQESQDFLEQLLIYLESHARQSEP